MEDTTWRARASCKGAPIEFFFPTTNPGESDDAAERREVGRVKALCGQCPVKGECLEAARDEQPRSQQVGIRAGMTGADRRVYFKEHPRP